MYTSSASTRFIERPARGLTNDKGIASSEARELLGDEADSLAEQIELVRGASHEFDLDLFLKGKLTPVFFGTALGNFGVREMLNDFVEWAPAPQP